MTDIRHERRLRRHQESPDVILPTSSGEAPSPTPPTSSSGEGANISEPWKPMDDWAFSGAPMMLKLETGEVVEASYRATRAYDPKTGRWGPRSFWMERNNPTRIVIGTPVAYVPA